MMKPPQRELHTYTSEISERADVRAGSPLPLGTQERGGGVNLSIFSRNATAFDSDDRLVMLGQYNRRRAPDSGVKGKF